MARVPKAELLQPFFLSAGETEAGRGDWDVPAGLISQALREVTSAGCVASSVTEADITAIADEFAVSRSTECYWGEPGAQKQLLKELGVGGDVLVIRHALAPEYVIELSKYLHPYDAEWLLDPVGEPADVISRVRRAASRFVLDYQPTPGRRTDLALETAVRALVDLLELALVHDLRIAQNKNNARCGPSPNCVGSRVIELLLIGIDRALTTTAVMNMILKVKRKPKPTEDHLLVLFRSSPVGALDASLHPYREEAISQLRSDPINGFA
jgi:hypothetical protein